MGFEMVAVTVAAAGAVTGWLILALGVPPWRRLLVAWLRLPWTSDRTGRAPALAREPSVLDREFPLSSPGAPAAARPRPRLADRLAMTRRLVEARGVVLWVPTVGDAALEVLAADGYADGLLERQTPMVQDARSLAATAFADRRLTRRQRQGVRLAAVAVPVDHDGVLAGVLTVEFEPATVTPPDEPVRRLQQVALQLAPHLPRAQPLSPAERALSAFAPPSDVEGPAPAEPRRRRG